MINKILQSIVYEIYKQHLFLLNYLFCDTREIVGATQLKFLSLHAFLSELKKVRANSLHFPACRNFSKCKVRHLKPAFQKKT
ncbi:MAG: hypothetical protein RLZZ628_4300 [Bacteroidota bacterium]|jgi:hypothetical protein